MAFGKEEKKEKRGLIIESKDPLEILKLRFANGEISVEEFQEKYELLKNIQLMDRSII